jgi:hypothetical protein
MSIDQAAQAWPVGASAGYFSVGVDALFEHDPALGASVLAAFADLVVD